jgi:putative FmdB family regulatory protein
MPNYEYKCVSCQEVSESFFPIQAGPAPAITCSCGHEAFRVFSHFGIQLKGGGWGGQ